MNLRRFTLLALALVVAERAMGDPLPERSQTVAGWTLSDTGGRPGDDIERVLHMTRQAPGVTMTYTPGANGENASIRLQFTRCNGQDYGSGFDFGNPPGDHAKVIRDEVHEAYADFAKTCHTPPADEAVLLAGFDEALKTIEQWLAARPFVYPPEPASSAGDN